MEKRESLMGISQAVFFNIIIVEKKLNDYYGKKILAWKMVRGKINLENEKEWLALFVEQRLNKFCLKCYIETRPVNNSFKKPAVVAEWSKAQSQIQEERMP